MKRFLLINDKSAAGTIVNQLMLSLPKDWITVEELLQTRIAEERTLYGKALQAFRENGFCIHINRQQVKHLNEEIAVHQNTEVSFVELRPEEGQDGRMG